MKQNTLPTLAGLLMLCLPGTGLATNVPPPPSVMTTPATALAEMAETKRASAEVPETQNETHTDAQEKEKTTPHNNPAPEFSAQIDALTAQLHALEGRLSLPRGSLLIAEDDEEARLGYAAGVMYARTVQALMAEDRLAGVTRDERALQAGLSDAMAGRPLQMTPESLDAALAVVTAATEKARGPVVAREAEKAQAWLKMFREQPGVAEDASGYWYRVTHEGDGAFLTADDVVDVVVEESLTDGTIISDMEVSGSHIRQAVKDFPPVFASALARLRNHGQITLGVPPELAYGSRGYPPRVPPGATLVYRLRVSDVVEQKARPAKVPETDAGAGVKTPTGKVEATKTMKTTKETGVKP